MKPPWFPKVAHAVHRVEVPLGQRDWMREAGRGRSGKGDWVLSYNYDAFSVAANSICFGHIKMLSVLPTIRVSPSNSLYLCSSLSPCLSFLLPSFFCCSLNAQIEFICCEFPMHTKWIFVSCLGYVQCHIYIRYIYGDRERDMFVCLPRGHCCIIWSGGWLKNNSIWFYLHCFDGFKRCTTLCQAAYGKGV